MMCALQPLRSILPPWLKQLLDGAEKEQLREIRLRRNYPAELNYGMRFVFSKQCVEEADLSYILNAASRYSPWTVATMAKGYVTISGGHRIGLCGQTYLSGSKPGFRSVESLCIRVCRDVPEVAAKFSGIKGSVLIIGAPGYGKTTLLRDLSRSIGQKQLTVVVDERGELFPAGYPRGQRMDVLSLCSKEQGIEMALRTMGPEVIAVDEITAAEDSAALVQAANCGVRLLATAHAHGLQDLQQRSIYKQLMEKRIFDNIICLQKDQTAVLERKWA